MLEQMRRSSQSLLIYLIFGIVIAVFIINFGPQSQGSGCGSDGRMKADHAAQVSGTTLSLNDFRFAYLMMGGGQATAQVAKRRQLKERVMDRLIDRELLAQEAERMGFRVNEREVEDVLLDSRIALSGFEQPAPFFQKDGHFDYDQFKRFVQYQLGWSPKSFIESQERELLAARGRQVLAGGVGVSAEAVKEEFLRENDQVNLEYVRFNTRRAEGAVDLEPAAVTTWLAANEAKVKERFEQRKVVYENVPKQRKLRQLLVKTVVPETKKPAAAEDTADKPDEKAQAAEKEKEKLATEKAEKAAQKKADDLAARIRKGEAFAAVAKASSDDAGTKARGGALGWKGQGSTTLGPSIEEKVFAAKDGELVGPLKGADGFYLVVAEGTREGKIAYDQVKAELAEELMRQDRAKELAKSEAESALVKVKAAGDKSLKDLYPAPKDDANSVDTVHAEETGLSPRVGARIGNLGDSAALVKAAFALTKESPLAGPFEVGGAFVIVKLKEHKAPDMAEFEKKKAELTQMAQAQRGGAAVTAWLERRCKEVHEQKKISVNTDVLQYEEATSEKEPAAPKYEPCQRRMSLPF